MCHQFFGIEEPHEKENICGLFQRGIIIFRPIFNFFNPKLILKHRRRASHVAMIQSGERLLLLIVKAVHLQRTLGLSGHFSSLHLGCA